MIEKFLMVVLIALLSLIAVAGFTESIMSIISTLQEMCG